MGANCCVATRGKPLPNRNSHEVSTYRNIRHSPSWSFRWHSRTQIEDIAENMLHSSHINSENDTPEVKSGVDTETDSLSDGENPPKAFRSSQRRKSFKSRGSEFSKSIPSDQNTAGSSSPEVNGSPKSSCLPSASFIKSSVGISHLSPPGKTDENPSSSRIRSRHSPGHGHQLCFGSRVPPLESPISSPELSQPSFVLSNDHSAGGSHCGSSDGWSMRTFSELVASSQRERWSFDSHETLSSTNKRFGSSISPKTCHSPYPRTCSLCSKLLKEKSPWGAHKILSTSDYPIAAVLFCGHIYHAECLESFTSETEMYDPPCPVCSNNGERPALKPLAPLELKGGKNKILNRDSSPNDRRKNGKGPVMGASSSMKASSSGKPFLMRRFSTRPRPVRSASESETTGKKRFWLKYRRE